MEATVEPTMEATAEATAAETATVEPEMTVTAEVTSTMEPSETVTGTMEPSETVTGTMEPGATVTGTGAGTDLSGLQTEGNFSILVQGLTSTGLDQELANLGPVTLLAPSDEAFGEIDSDTFAGLVTDTQRLSDVLLYHVVSGTVTSADLATMTEVTTVQGLTLSVTSSGGTVMIGGAEVITPDIMLGNNVVVHIIDRVLMPEDMTTTP